MRRRWVLAAAVVAATVAACAGGDDGAVPVTTGSTAGTTTTVRASTTSTTLDFETEVKLAALQLLELRNEVFQNPDESRVSEYIADTCVCLERERQIVADLVATGRHWTGPAIVPLGITITANDEFGVVLTIAAQQPAGEIVGSDGSTAVPAEDFAPYRVSLIEAGPGTWRINAISGVSLTDEAFAAIEAEGIP